MRPNRSFSRLESHLQSSWLICAADALASAVATTVCCSATAQLIQRGRDRFHSTAVEGRVRSAGVILATATIGHLLLLRFVPAHVAPALPKVFWILVGLTALVVAFAAKPVSQAWKSSALARLSAFVSRS